MVQTINVVVVKRAGLSVTKMDAAPIQTVQVRTEPSLTVSGAAGRLDTLRDVDATAEVEGATPVYHAADDKYDVRRITFDDIDSTNGIDGGSF